VVFSRGRRTHVVNPVSGNGTFDDVPHEVVQATYAPIGEGFAYIGHNKVGAEDPATWYLYAGVSPFAAADRRVELDIGAGRLLGWRDAEHVVVGDFLQHLRVVDVRTGAVDRVALSSPDETFPSPAYAADLWANDLVDGVRPDRVHDPRWDVGLAASGLLGALLVAGLVVRGRRRRVRP
jgi:hypothetical protein